LGETRTHKVDVRVIAATNQNLTEKIASDQFRQDLYYRLNVVSIHTPSLREISTDIPLVANHLLALYCSELAMPQKRFSEDALKILVSKKWNGNIRELQNEIKRVVIFSKGQTINPEDFSCECLRAVCPEDSLSTICNLAYKEARKSILEKFNVQYITNLLKDLEGNVSLSAKKASIERQSLQQLMRKYGINADDYRKSANKI